LAAAFPRIGDAKARYAPSGLAGDPPYPGDLPTGCTFHVRCPWATDECATTDPALRQTEPGRAVACIHADGTNAKTDTPRAPAVDTRAAEDGDVAVEEHA
jgi:peptide/nickel transport system ATP-binding protein